MRHDGARSDHDLRGFTYIEILVMITITVLIASLVMPQLLANRRSRELWAFKRDIETLAIQSRSHAIDYGVPVSLTYDPKANQIVAIAEQNDGSTLKVRGVDLPDGLKPLRFSSDKNELQGQDWRMPYYSDGATSGGGVEISSGDDTFSFVQKPGEAPGRWTNGPLPDLSLERWTAGGYEKRS